MAHCWVSIGSELATRVPLDHGSVALADLVRAAGAADNALASSGAGATVAADAALIAIAGSPGAWALLAKDPVVHLNGLPLSAGLAVLEDKDLIACGALLAWFSTEVPAQVAPYPPGQGQCPRCKSAMEAGQPAVRCPRCNVWYHQLERECWTYGDTCVLCGQPTALDADYQWTPEDL